MREFIVAAERIVNRDEEGEEEVLEIPIAGQAPLRAYYPTTGQISLVYAARGYAAQLRAIHAFLDAVLLDDGYSRVTGWLDDGLIDIGFLFGGDDQNEGGLVDEIISETVARPTGSSGGSSASPKSAGRRSTGRAPGKGSTLSNSRPTAS